jgi:hypothetical protein
MGDMTIKGFQESSLLALAKTAEADGVSPEELARDILEREIRRRSGQRGALSRAMLARQTAISELDSVSILRELRENS